MFPLGTVLLPGQPLPLHVFEPRYLSLVQRCLGSSPEFGVVLIERGSEVGGHDTRCNTGTVARITDVAQLPDGRLMVLAMGVRRVRIAAWLPDDPHPWAEVTEWPDDEACPTDVPPAPGVDAVTSQLRRVLALRSELGEPVPDATFDVVEGRAAASYQLCAIAPLGALDRQALLVAPTVDDRLRSLSALLADDAALLEMRLGAG
jgi:Lon protease-like protein